MAVSSIARLAISLGLDASGIARGATQAKSMLGGLQTSIVGIGRSMSMALGGFSVAAIGKWGFDLAAQAETAIIQLEVLTGSARKATQIFGEMRQFAAVTPFETSHLQDAGNLLLAFGGAAEDVMPTIRMLGDVAGGNADRMHRLTLAYGQVQAAGKLMGQDLLQLINAGFNPLQEISKATGVSLEDLRAKMRAGGISFEMVKQAFESATGEGGRFHGMMDRMAGTLAGVFGMVKEKIATVIRAIAEKSGPSLKLLGQSFLRLGDAVLKFVNESGPLLAAWISFQTDIWVDFIDYVLTPLVQGLTWAAREIKLIAQGLNLIDDDLEASMKNVVTPDRGMMAAMKDAFKGLMDDSESATDAFDEMFEKLKTQGETLTQSLRTPMEVLRDEMESVNGLILEGAISWQTYSRQIEKLENDFKTAIESKNKLQASVTPGVGAATRFSTAGFSAVQESNRMLEAQKRAEDKRSAQHAATNQKLDAAVRGIERIRMPPTADF